MSRAPAAHPSAQRLFFALWPSAEERAALARASAPQVSACGGRPIPVHNLHVTLAFLGDVARERVPQLDLVARAVAGAQPPGLRSLCFMELAHWLRPQILCAPAATQAPHGADFAAVAALAAALKDALARAGFLPDLKPFHAHVTVARKVARAPQSAALPPVAWRCDACALVASRTDAGGSVYSVLESYPLVSVEKSRK
jgi:RNA 2',3'-cyclic 3'-phosphodiesterase